MKNWNQENEDGVGASLEFPKPLNESGCPPHMLKLWEGAVCMVMRKLNADLKLRTHLVVDRVSARSVCVVQSHVYEGTGFACGDESACALHFPHHVQVADQA